MRLLAVLLIFLLSCGQPPVSHPPVPSDSYSSSYIYMKAYTGKDSLITSPQGIWIELPEEIKKTGSSGHKARILVDDTPYYYRSLLGSDYFWDRIGPKEVFAKKIVFQVESDTPVKLILKQKTY